MDPELDNIISILNSKTTASNTQARFRIRNSKPTNSRNRQTHSLPPQKIQIKQISTEKSIEIETNDEIPVEMMHHINEFYKEQDEEYKKSVSGKIGAPVL